MCSYVKIRGGPLASKHAQSFTPGKNPRSSVPTGNFVSHKKFIGEWGGEECPNNPLHTGLPGEFSNGKSPPKVLLKYLGGSGINARKKTAGTASHRIRARPTCSQGPLRPNQHVRLQTPCRRCGCVRLCRSGRLGRGALRKDRCTRARRGSGGKAEVLQDLQDLPWLPSTKDMEGDDCAAVVDGVVAR